MRIVGLLALGLCWAGGWSAETDPPTDFLGDPLPTGAVARLGTARFRTTGEVHAVAVSSDGRWVAWGGDCGLRVCETATGKPVFSARGRGGEEESIHALEFSSDGRWLLSGGDVGNLCLWDLKTWNARTFKGHESSIACATFSRDGQHVASCDDDGNLILWDVAQGLALRKYSSEEETISVVAFSPDGRHLACGYDDGRLRLLDVQTFESLREVEAHGANVRSLTFSLDGNRLASGGADSTVRIWETRELRPVWAGEANDQISKVLFTKDGATILTADEEGYLQWWDATTGQSKRRFLVGSDPGETNLYTMALAPDEKTIYCGGNMPCLRIMDVETGRPVERCEGHQSPARQLVFSPDSQTLASGSEDGTIHLWDVATGRQKFARQLATGWESRAVFSPDGKRIACTGLRVLHIWNAETGEPLAFGQGSPDVVQRLICCPDGRGPLTISGASLALWSFEDGRRLTIGAPHDETVGVGENESGLVELKAVFDGRTLLAATNKVRCIDLATGRDFSPEGLDLQPGPLAVSTDGRWLVGRSPEGLSIWESASLKKMSKLEMQDDSNGVPITFSPDNRLILVCSTSERSALLLDFFSGIQIGKLSAGDGYFVSAETSPDGRWLALGNSDTSILIYRWETLVPKRDRDADSTKAELDAAYEDLAAEPEKAFAAIGRFLRAGAAGAAYLDARLKPVRADVNAIDALVADLNNDDFTLREKATVSLLGLGLLAEPQLRKMRALTEQLEVQKRLDAILQDLALPLVRSKELLRNLRIIGILENTGSKEAQAALEKRKGGEAGSIEDQAIHAALQRLSRRPPGTLR